MLCKHNAWQTNVIATLSSAKYDTHHAFTSVSYRIITTDWQGPERQAACVCVCAETETITESERNSTDHAGIHTNSVCLSPDSRRLSEEQQQLPAGSACISHTKSFQRSGDLN